MDTAAIIGTTVANIARDELLLAPQAGPRPAIRITGFNDDEVVRVVQELSNLTIPGRPGYATIKVGTQREVPGLPPSARLAADETLTNWRNASTSALVLIELDVQDDESGLRGSIHQLNDRNVLATASGEVRPDRLAMVLEKAWESGKRGQNPPPHQLVSNLDSVWRAVLQEESLSLRRWARFVAAICGELARVEVLSVASINAATGGNLHILGMFPDPPVFDDSRATRTRLARNIRCGLLKQPTGAGISEDDLIARIEEVSFDEQLLSAYGRSASQLRSDMRRVVKISGAETARREIELDLWLQLFERRAQNGLGAQIRARLESSLAGRVEEYDSLDVEAGLDRNEQDAAEKLVLAEPPGGLDALIDSLPSTLRRRVERLAYPDARVEPDPLRALLHSLYVLELTDGKSASLSVEGPPEQGTWTRWLFSTLYGSVLESVSELASAEEGVELRIADVLRNQAQPDIPDDDPEESEWDDAWAPLRLVVTRGESGVVRRFRWDPQANPGLIAFAAVLTSVSAVRGAEIDQTFEEWCGELVDPRRWPAISLEGLPASGPVALELEDLRRRHLGVLSRGLRLEALDDYVTEWGDFLQRARAELVPRNSPLQELESVVMTDVIALPQSRLAMLATHPLRLRWVSSHYRRMTELLVKALCGNLRLNPENSELFFDWLDRVSPHRLPPFVSGRDELVSLAVRETGWHEEYAPVRRSGREDRDWLANVDDTAVDEMVGVLSSYLDAYPHKLDGLVLLLLSRDGNRRLPIRLIQRLRAKHAARIELNLFAPRSQHHDLVNAFEGAFGDDETAGDRLFPDVQLVLRDWNVAEPSPDLSGLVDGVDVALCPAVFGTRTSLNNLTRDPNATVSGEFNPWIHSPTHDQTENTDNVVRVLLPQQGDVLLESWSTLCVRQSAHSAVAPNSDSNTDYFSLQVRFDRQQQLFLNLHSVAHWVVTLDSFIGRDQIDSMNDEQRPDVILVRNGVGKNESYTLIVSSGTGRRFVVDRLIRKLVYDLRLDPDEVPVPELARRLFEIGRHVVPGAVLRALGLGRAAQEILGLVVSRFEVSAVAPVDRSRPAMEVWISFDEHTGWFGRAQRTRADLGRFVFWIDDAGEIHLSILVVESKFRREIDASTTGVAAQQLDRTVELCRSAFGFDQGNSDDADFWWQELANAIEQISRRDYPSDELPSRLIHGPARSGFGEEVLRSIRSKQVSLNDVAGIAVTIASEVAEEAPGNGVLGQHTLHRVHRPELIDVLLSILGRRDPAERSVGHGLRSESAVSEDARAIGATVHNSAPAESGSLPPSRGSGRSEAGELESRSTETPERASNEQTRNVELGLGEAGLRDRYERLLDVFAQHSVKVGAPVGVPWSEGPGFYVLRVVPGSGVTVDKVMSRVGEIQLALSLPSDSRVRATLDRGAIVFEVPKSEDERYPVLISQLWPRVDIPADGLVVPLGEDIQGDPVCLNFSSPDSPHLLVAGTTGSGKSVALESILHGLCRYAPESLELRLVDPKGTELQDFEEFPHLKAPIGLDAQDAVSILEAAVVEMQERYSSFRPLRARSLAQFNGAVADSERKPWQVIVLDEYADLTSDPDDKSTIEKLLRRLAQKARAAGIHVVVATQRPSADVVSTTIRSNFPAQLALRVKSATDSRIILDEAGAEALAGQGDAFLRTARGLTRLQVAYFDL